jgi:tRNA threonylcarbamoyladenosine biosynthesis protein TsaB
MVSILNIETSTSVCSVALSVNGEIVSIKESDNEYSHAEQITLFSQEVLEIAGKKMGDLDAIAVSKGPGSYTGLRIGVSTAKGFCYSLGIPLIAVSTLEAMAVGIQNLENVRNVKAFVSPMIDARRMEVYNAIFDSEMSEILPIGARIIDEDSFNELLTDNKIFFAGDGAPKCKEALSKNENAVFIDNFNPSAAYVALLANRKFNKSEFEDTAYFEPFYLKDFVAGIPKVKGLK